MRWPLEVSPGGPQDLLQVPARCDDEVEQGGVRVLLLEGLSPVVGAPGPGEEGGQEHQNLLHCIPYFSDFSEFSDFGYNFRLIANLYYL